MANTARKNITKLNADWLCRDTDSWRVRVPCQGGSGRFRFKEYGGSEKALKAARVFQAKALRLYDADKKFREKHGSVPKRETLYITNRTGYTGVVRMVSPNMDAAPLVTWLATWSVNGRVFSKRFSTAHYSEPECKRRAIKHRREMMTHILQPTN